MWVVLKGHTVFVDEKTFLYQSKDEVVITEILAWKILILKSMLKSDWRE